MKPKLFQLEFIINIKNHSNVSKYVIILEIPTVKRLKTFKRHDRGKEVLILRLHIYQIAK